MFARPALDHTRFRGDRFYVDARNRVVEAQRRVPRASRAERGATMAEYGLLLALIAVVAIGAVSAFGRNISDIFDGINTDITSNANLDTSEPAGP